MDSVPHQLQTLLQLLGTDASSVAHLTHIMDCLSPSCLAPSPHLQNWVSRVTSLMHSKDPAARWAAICIACRMSFLSKSLLVENAQSWIGIIFPSLSKPEPSPVLRASMLYLAIVLCAAGHNLEFQRQVAVPIVPKVSSALLTIAEKHSDRELKTSSIQTLGRLVPVYPSLHKALSQRLFALCHQIFSGSMRYAKDSLLDATVNLYAVLHFLGGRVGATNLWRNCLDEILQFSWSGWLTLRTTFPSSARLSQAAIASLRLPDGKLPNLQSHTDPMTGNPLTTVVLNLNRLKCSISAIGALLRVPVNQPVRVPIGRLAFFCWCLLTSDRSDEGQAYFDPRVRIVESAVVPQIWVEGCRLLSYLAEITQESLSPHTTRLMTVISSRLESNLERSERYSFLRCANHLLFFCPVVGATPAINRLLKAAVLHLSPLCPLQPRSESNSGATDHLKPTKKRRREYEADSALSSTETTVCATIDECDALITAVEVVSQCMLNVELSPSTRSLADRVLLSILLSLPSMPPSSLSSDSSFHGRLSRKIRDVCVESVQGTSHAMNRSTSLVLRSFSSGSLVTRNELHHRVDLLLHPRRPPFVRTLPFVENLLSAEENIDRPLDATSGNGEMPSNTSKLRLTPVIQSSQTHQQTSPYPPQEQTLLTTVESPPQVLNDTNGRFSVDARSSFVAPVVPLLQATPEVLGKSSLPISQKAPAPSLYVAPMLVDESDQEEVPAIDLGSDSDG